MSLKDKKVLMNGIDYIYLDSVGSTLTSENKVFPIGETNEIAGVHLYDVTDEWFTSLSSEDLTDLFEFVELRGDVVKVIFNQWKTKLWGKWEEVNNCYMNLETI